MKRVVLLTGKTCTGKSRLAELLRDELSYVIFDTACFISEKAHARGATDKQDEMNFAELTDSQSAGRWVHEAASELLGASKSPLVVDHILTHEQLETFRRDHTLDIIHVHLYAKDKELERRYILREKSAGIETIEEIFHKAKNDSDIDFFKEDADLRINTSRSEPRDTLVRVAAKLGHYPPPDVRVVDIIVGGQYGSEGKGNVAAYLAKEYDVLVRVGGPNAGHSVSSPSGVYVYHQLPSGARDTTARLLLGPGMTIHVPSLLKEIDDCGITPDRLFIDPQAMIIEESDREQETELVKEIASTGQGGGAAAARRITGRGTAKTRLAKHIAELAPYVGMSPPYRGSTIYHLENAYRAGASILLEGTQGSGLSLYHGDYPHVTSRDTNVAGCLSEAGISPSHVRRIMMVVRATPIRVGNPEGNESKTSGELRLEINLEQISLASGIPLEELQEYERTSTTKRARRIGWFDWSQFRQACSLNAPTDIVLTFADYLTVKNRDARRFEQLHQDTIKFVEELERVAHAPVSLINTRFPRDEMAKLDLRSVIDRRNWNVTRLGGKLNG